MELLEESLLSVHVFEALEEDQHLSLLLLVLVPGDLQLLRRGKVLRLVSGTRIVLFLELLLHRNCCLLQALELLLVVHFDLLEAVFAVLQVHRHPLVVVLQTLDLFLVHGFSSIGHLHLHLEFLGFLLRLVDLLVKFDYHLGVEALVGGLLLLRPGLFLTATRRCGSG